LSFHAIKKLPDFRQQASGDGLNLVLGNICAIFLIRFRQYSHDLWLSFDPSIYPSDAYGNNLVLAYDEANQLTQVQKNGKYTEFYTYDATGYRVGRAAGGVLTDYVYWGNNLLYEITSGQAVDYIRAKGKLLAKVENSGTTYFHHDFEIIFL
jgi:YD repeat-containing protein